MELLFVGLLNFYTAYPLPRVGGVWSVLLMSAAFYNFVGEINKTGIWEKTNLLCYGL